MHVAAAFVFVLAHGVSVFASYPLGGPTCSPAWEDTGLLAIIWLMLFKPF